MLLLIDIVKAFLISASLETSHVKGVFPLAVIQKTKSFLFKLILFTFSCADSVSSSAPSIDFTSASNPPAII